MKDMYVFERDVNGLRYRIAAQSVWDPVRGRSVARQTVLGPATAPPVADLGATRTVGMQAVGDVGALIWVAEQLDLIGHIDRACGNLGAKGGPSVGELAVAVAIQRACSPGPKRDLAEFLDGAVPRLSCLPSSAFSGQAYHRVAGQVTDEQLEQAQIAIANAAVARFELSADVLAFDTTNFDTHIATVTPGELARRGHAKSKRSDLRVVGLGVLVSETGHVPLLYRTYSGNSSDQAVVDRVPGWVEGTAPVAGPWGVPRKGAADTGTRWRVLESSTGTGSGRCRLLQPDLVAAGTCGGGTGAADGGQARCDEAPDGQTGPGARGAGASEGRQPGPHAGGGREPGTAGGSETRHWGGVAQGQGGVKQAGSAGKNETYLAQQPGATDKEDAGP